MFRNREILEWLDQSEGRDGGEERAVKREADYGTIKIGMFVCGFAFEAAYQNYLMLHE